MIKNELQERVAKIICNKSDEITCDECFKMKKTGICEGHNCCRISEKTEEQLEYILSDVKNNTFLRACAGSGKTEVVGMKAAYEIKQWTEMNKGIAVLSFTNDAVEVIKNRVKQFVENDGVYPHYIGTLSSFIHGYIVQPFAYKCVGYQGNHSDFSINIVEEQIQTYSNHWLENYQCSIPYLSTDNRRIPICANQIGADLEKKDFYFWIKKKLFWLKDYYDSERIQQYIYSQRKRKPYFWTWEYVKECFWECKKLFWSKGFANFDDLNVLAVRIIKRDIGNEIVKRFPIIFIDECQDLSANELEVLKQLKEKGCHIHFIGDLNQSIYEFKRVNPDVIAECVKNFEKYYLTKNFRSCEEIVNFSEQLIGQDGGVSQDVESKFKEQALLYIEYDNPEDAVQKYVELLEKLGCKEYNNRILVKQNSLRRKLERATKDKYDTKEPLIVAAQLWKEKSQSQMHTALELAGLQISRWFGGGNIKKNYYCPKEICSVFAWRIYLMSVLNEIEKTEVLMDFSQTYGDWHKIARRKLNSILESQYTVLKEYDENEKRELDNIVNGKNFRVSSGNKDVVINDMVCNYVTDIPIMTIHGSKGCTFDTTLVISSENVKSEGGHWKKHWIEGVGEEKRLGYVASTRAKYLLVWGVPRLKNEEKQLIEGYGFKDSEIIKYKGENESTNTFAEKNNLIQE